MWKSKHPEYHFNMHNNIKPDLIDYSYVILGYVFKEISLQKNLNKSLATWLVFMYKFTHFYFSTKSD